MPGAVDSLASGCFLFKRQHIFLDINMLGLKFMVNVGKYSIHGASGYMFEMILPWSITAAFDKAPSTTCSMIPERCDLKKTLMGSDSSPLWSAANFHFFKVPLFRLNANHFHHDKKGVKKKTCENNHSRTKQPKHTKNTISKVDSKRKTKSKHQTKITAHSSNSNHDTHQWNQICF